MDPLKDIVPSGTPQPDHYVFLTPVSHVQKTKTLQRQSYRALKMTKMSVFLAQFAVNPRPSMSFLRLFA